MRASNFCVECGERLARTGWRARFAGSLCDECARRLGQFVRVRPLIATFAVAITAFAIGKYVRPSPPPLIIQRAANSPLSDAPVNLSDGPRPSKPIVNPNPNVNVAVAASDDAVYICGARTKKGTPCHRRVHGPGERCFQHKGMAAMLPVEKLKITP